MTDVEQAWMKTPQDQGTKGVAGVITRPSKDDSDVFL